VEKQSGKFANAELWLVSGFVHSHQSILLKNNFGKST
jgi:hypothetical protein